MAYSAATRAFKAINSAVDDIEKRRKKEGESFTYEPWAVPSEEEQSIRAAQVNQRYADIAQNGPDAAAIAGREAMKSMQAQQKYLQYQREMEEQRNNRLLQNGFTQGDLSAYQNYQNASAGIQSGLQNIADIQRNTLTGFDRRVGNTTGTFSATRAANQFKQENNLDDEAYNRLMAGYKTYRAKQSLAAEDSYSGITDEQKNELSQIGKMQNTEGLLNDITGKTMRNRQEAKDLSNQFKQKYGVDDATYSTWQGMNDQEDAEKEEAQNTRISASRASRISSDEINKLDRESRSAIDQYMKGYKQSQTSAGTGSLFENLKGQFSLPSTQMKGIFEGRQMMENARQRLRSLGYSESDIKKYEEYAQVYAEDSLMSKDQKEAQNHPLSSNANAVLTDATLGMATGLSQFVQDTSDQAYRLLTGNRAKNDSPNNFGVGHRNGARAARYSSNVQEGTQKAILNGNEENPSFSQKAVKQLYTMGYSAAQSHLTNVAGAFASAALGGSVAGEVAALLPFFSSGYYQGKMNAEERGINNDSAYLTAGAEGVNEVLTELGSDRVLKAIFKEDSIKNILKETLKGSAEEGGEEIANNILNAIADRVINGDKSELNQSVQNYVAQGASQKDAIVQTAVDFIQQSASDFLNAAGSTLIGMGPNFAARTIENRTSGNELFKNYTAQDYRDLQDSYDLDKSKASYPLVKKASDLASQYAEKLDKGEKVTTRDRAKLWDTTSEIAGAEQTAAENRERDEKKKQLKEDIKWGFREAFGRNKATEGQQAAEQTNTTESSDTQKTATVEPQNVPEEHRAQSTDIAPNDAYAKMAAAQNGEELRNAYQEAIHSTNEETRERADSDLQIVSGMLQKRGISAEEIESAKISTEDAYAAGYSGQEISENVPAAVKIAYNDGQKQAIEDRARQTLEARDSVKRTAAKQLTDSARKFIESGYKDGMNAAAYNTVIPAAINAGRTGVTFEEYSKKNGASLQFVDDGLAKRAYEVGQQIAIEDLSKETARAMAERNGVKEFGTGTFIDSRTDKSGSISGARVMKAVARMTGLNIVFTDNGFDGKTNGYYNPENSTIYLNSDMADRVASTLSHEGIGEFSAVWNPDEYAKVVKDIMQASQEIYGTAEFNLERQKYVDAYSKEKGKTDADVDKEMANDVLYQLVGTEKGVKKLLEQIDQNHSHEEAKSIKQKLADWVHKMVESIKNLLDEFRPNSYQRKMAEANLDRFEKLQDEVIHSFAGAINNYSAAKAQSQQAVATGSNTRSSNEVENKNTYGKADYVKDHDYSYDRLSALGNIPLYNVNSFNFKSIDYSKDTKRGDILSSVKGNIERYNKATGYAGNNSINNKSLGGIIVSSAGLRHGMERMSPQLLEMYENLPSALANAIVINEGEGERGTKQEYVLIGAFETKTGEIGIVRFSVNEYENSNNLDGIHLALYASRSKALKREGVAYNTTQGSSGNADALKPSLSLSVSQLLDLVKEAYPNELSKSVADHFGISRGTSDIRNIRFSKQIREVHDEIAYTKEKKDLTGDEKIEKTKDFIAVHNLTMNQLMKDIDMGGFPSPSIAIIRSAMQHTRYGDVSVIFNRDTIDPERSKANKVYGGDAWTPTFPGIEYDVNEDKYYSVMHSVDDAMKGKVPEYLRAEAKKFNTPGMNSTAEKGGVDAVVEKAKDNYGMKAAYLASKGETIEDQVRQKEVRKYDDEKVNRFDKMEEAIAPVEDEFLKDRSTLSIRDMLQKYGDRIQQAYEAYAETVPEDQRKRWTNRVKRANEKAFFAYNVIDDIANAIDYYNNGNESHTENERDTAAIEKQINSKVDPEGYEAWLRETYDGLIRDEGIYNGKELFTESGNRRSFKQTHYAVTLENIVRAMNSKGTKGVGTFFGAAGVREEAIKNFKSVDEMHQNEDMLRTMDQDEYKEMEGEYIEQIGKIAHRIMRTGDNSFIQADNAADAILDAVRTRKTAAGIEKALKSYGMNVYEGVGNDILNLMHKISEMPTEYFEAKPQRAVGLDEIAMVVAPDTITKEQTRKLNENRIPLQTYEAGNEDARHQVIEDLQDVRFSREINDNEDSLDKEQKERFEKIRRDIGIDDYVTDQELWSDHYDTKKSLIEVLRSGNEILKNSDIDETAVRRIAREIKEQYHSNIDVNELAENLAKVFRYAQGQNYIDYDDLATVISEVASPVIDGSVTKVGAEEFKQFKNALQGVTYNLDSKQEAEVVSAFGSWGNFRKAIPGVKFTRDGSGVSLDGVWSTLVQETGYVLDMDTSSNDMPLALVDAYNSMKPEYQNAFGEDATQAAQDVAMEIVARYYQYSAGQEKLKLKAKQKQELLDQARRMAASNAEYRKKIKQEYQKRYEAELSKVKQSGGRSEPVSKQVAKLRARNARTVASIREEQRRKDELRRLRTPVKNIMDMLTSPTDKKHVPAFVQTPVLQLAAAFDFVPQTVRETADGKFSIRILESRDINADGSYSYKWRTIRADSREDAIAQYKKAMDENGLGSAENKSWQERLWEVQNLYQQDESDDWFERSELKQGLDKELGEKLGKILRDNQGMLSIAQLSSSELRTLNEVVRNVLHAVNQINRMYSKPSQHVSDIAHMAMDRTTSGVKGRREHFKPVATLVDTLTLDHASPETYFHGIFGGENTDPITKILIGAHNKKSRDIHQAQDYMADVCDRLATEKEMESWMNETKNYYGLDLTTTQIMSLYELSKRPDAQQHKIGGFVADESNREKVSGQRLPVQLTDAQIKAITDTLTPQQKQMADAMQYYLAHQCAEQGNETCMQLYGYEKFVDEHYFPMTTDKNTIATRDSNVTQGAINAIKNSGFTKDITPEADNPLVLRDIFMVYVDHVAQMATYHAWAAPLQDLIRFFNYNEKAYVEREDGQKFAFRNSVKDAIDYYYGKKGQEYFVKLISSINDREKSSFVGGDFYDMLTGHAKTAATLGNGRVIIQQPTAIFRAGEMISYKYLNEGMAGKYRKEAAELRDRTSDVFWLKNQGNIDGYITQSLVSTITGVKTTREKILDFVGKPASKADEITWAAMYRAVYAEQVDKLGKEKIGTKEFEDAVNDRFSEIVLRTQVYDSVITRSQFMRSPDTKNRMMSAFMAEPVKSYNMILRDMIDISQAEDERQVKKAKAHLVRVTAPVLLITHVINAAAMSFADAFRSAGDPDDEDKNFLRRFMDAMGFGNWLDEDASFGDKLKEFLNGNLVDNMDLLRNIPMVAQYWDATKEGAKYVLGESTYSSDSDLSMSGVKNFFKAVKAIVNPGEKMTTYGKVAALTRAFSDLSGYPLYAAQRDVVAIYNTLLGRTFEQLPVLQKTTKYTPKRQAKLDVYTAALESGGDYKKAIEDAVAQGNDYKAISKGISDSYKDTYLALKETNPNEAIKMKNRLVTLYVYLSDKAGTNKDKTTSEKKKYYSDNIDKWK